MNATFKRAGLAVALALPVVGAMPAAGSAAPALSGGAFGPQIRVVPQRNFDARSTTGMAPSDRGIASEVAHARNLTDMGRLPANKPVDIGILMRVRNQAQLEQLTRLQGSRKSPLFHHYLSSAQFNNYFAPDAQSYARTMQILQRAGFRITRVYRNRGLVMAQAPSATVERYFSTHLRQVAQKGHGVRYLNDTAAVMPAELRQLAVSVSGLHSIVTMSHPIHFADKSLVMHSGYYARALAEVQNQRRAARTLRSRHPDNVPTPIGTSTPGANPNPDPTVSPGSPAQDYVNSIGGYDPTIYADAYDYPMQHGYAGRGHTTASVIEADYLNSDANAEFTTFGIKHTGAQYRECGPPDGGPTCFGTIGASDPEGESTLDALTIMSLAPAADFYEYLAPAFDDVQIEAAYELAVDQNVAEVVNSSFGGCETDDPTFQYAVNYIAMEGAALGMTFSASTGDTGSGNCGVYATNGAPQTLTNVSTPSSAYYFTAVGGTDFYMVAQCTGVGSACYTEETGWTDGGGGHSVLEPLPDWQATAVNAQTVVADASTAGRNTPDLAFTADELPPGVGIDIIYNGNQGAIGGTSVASPMFVAMQVEINQVQHSRNGWVNPGLYDVFNQLNAIGTNYAFRDITGGTNGAYQAVPGYDEVTGMGTPLGWELAGAENGMTSLPERPLPTPPPVPSATPSPVPTASPVPTMAPTPHPSGTAFVVTMIAGSGAGMSMDGTGLGSSFDNPTGIVYVASSAAGIDTQSTTDNFLFVSDFTTGYLRGMDLTTNKVVTYEDRQWNNATRASKNLNSSLLYGLAYLGPATANAASFGGLYVLSAGDASFSEVTLPTTPDPSATPDGNLKALTGGPAAAAFTTAGTEAGIVASKDGTLHLGQYAGAVDDDLTGSSALPNGGNFGIVYVPTGSANAGAPEYLVTDSLMNEIVSVTDVPMAATVATFASGAPLNGPKEITYLSSTSAYYVANCGGNNIVKVTTAGVMSVVAGDGAPRELNGANTGAEFSCPFGITNDGTNLYVTDFGGNTVRKITNVQ